MADERRRFFRITDTLGVSCEILNEQELAAVEEGVGLCPVDTFSLISGCDHTIHRHLEELRDRDETVAALIDAINRKLDFVINQLEVDNRTLRGISHKMKEVNISACGIAYITSEAIACDSVVSLNLLLKPSNQHLVTYGKVVGCEMCKGGFYVRINFKNMRVEDQELLIQHLVQRQGVKLREERS